MKSCKNHRTKVVTVILALAVGIMGLKSLQPKTMPLIPMMRLLLSDMYTVDEGI